MLARVFPRKTSMTPNDELCFFGDLPLFGTENISEVHISCLFTWDIPKAEYLYKSWQRLGVPVKIGGVAFNSEAGEFEPGRYVKQGATITSRGCNNNCWFCSVPKREGKIRELEIKPGNRILDNNILQTSDQHFLKVCEMLKQQPKAAFFDGIEAKMLNEFHIEQLSKLRIERMYLAYDTPDDYEPLVCASKLLTESNLIKKAYCYILCGYKNDTIEKTYERISQIVKLGFMPYVMYFQDKEFKPKPREWQDFTRQWSRPAAYRSEMNKILECAE